MDCLSVPSMVSDGRSYVCDGSVGRDGEKVQRFHSFDSALLSFTDIVTSLSIT